MQTLKISRVAMSRGSEVAVFRIALFEEIVPLALGDFARPGADRAAVRGTQTRPPSPRALSLISRSLSAPGMAVGWTWMNSPLAYRAPAWNIRLAALPVQAIELVERPKTSPQPPVASTRASAGKARISIVIMSWATQPRQRPVSSSTGPRKSHCSYLRIVPGHFPAPHLLVQGVEQLLAGRGPGEGRPPEERAAEAALIAKALGRAVERHAQPVHQVDDPRGPVGQFLHRRLVLEEIAAVDGILEMLPRAVAQLPGQIVDAVDPALGADAVRPLHRQQAHQPDVEIQFRQLHGGRHSRQPAADDHDGWFGHASASPCVGTQSDPELESVFAAHDQ